MLIFNPPNYNILKKIRFISILIFELILVIFFPILILIGYYYLYKSIKNYSITLEPLILIQCIIFFTIPIIMCIILKKFKMIKYSIAFIIYLPLYSIIIPIYSLLYSDDLKWGETRKTEYQHQTTIQIPESIYQK
jgi:chitin synthase